MLQHVRNAACAESHRLDTTGFDVAFIHDTCFQVIRHIDSTRCNQLEAPRHTAQNWQRAILD